MTSKSDARIKEMLETIKNIKDEDINFAGIIKADRAAVIEAAAMFNNALNLEEIERDEVMRAARNKYYAKLSVLMIECMLEIGLDVSEMMTEIFIEDAIKNIMKNISK